MIDCFFSDVSEHDMDMLILEEFACSSDFLHIFSDLAGLGEAKVLSVHSSKTDVALGESDITVIVNDGGIKIGLLIEDKIDAPAMPKQAERYFLRGQKGIEQKDYEKFFVYIVAPRKYLSQNAEAKQYSYQVEYEQILSYFEDLNDSRSIFKIQQIKHAIEKQKTGYQVEADPTVTEFWRKYSEYQKENFPSLWLIYNGEVKGANAIWPRFRTVVEKLYILHKTETGTVDLTFDNCASKIVDIEHLLSNTLGDYLSQGFTVQRTGKSAAVRLNVPILNLHNSFEEQLEAIDQCFASIQKLFDVVKQLNAERIELFFYNKV